MAPDNFHWINLFRIEPEFRNRQVRRVLFLAFLSVMISTAALGVFYTRLIDRLTGSELPFYFVPEEMHHLSAQLPGLRETLLTWFVVLALVNGLLSGLIGTVLTFKLARPLYRLKQELQRIGDGDLSVYTELHKGDEFQDLVDSLNQTTARLQVMIMGIQENVANIRTHEPNWEHSNKVENYLRNIEDELAYFTIVNQKVDGAA